MNHEHDREQWDACPAGELQNLAANQRRRGRRKFLGAVCAGGIVCVIAAVMVVSGRLGFEQTSSHNLTCAQTGSLLQAYARKTLGSQESEWVAEHLKNCPDCRRAYSDIQG